MPQSMWFCSSTDCAAVTYHKKIISHGENVQFFFHFFFFMVQLIFLLVQNLAVQNGLCQNCAEIVDLHV